MQEVFRAVVMRIGDFRRNRPGDTFRGWLFTITRHKLAAYWHRRKSVPPAVGGSESLRRLEAIEAQISSEVDANTGLELLCRRAMALVRSDFSDTAWAIFERVVIDEQRPADVARDLQVSVNMVYLTKSRVLRRLRQELRSLPDD